MLFHKSSPAVSDEFAKCLTNKGTKMYGSYQCSACKYQKDIFGSSFQYVNYVECGPLGAPPTNEACIQAGIESYPTWIINDTKHIIGVQQPSELSDITGCPLG